MLGNELVRNLVGTWMVPDRYLVVDRYLVGTCTIPYVRTVRYRKVRYGTVRYLAELPRFNGIYGGSCSPAKYRTVRYRTGTVRHLQ